MYDDWYDDPEATRAALCRLGALVGRGRALELGVCTGRLAIPLARAGATVVGVDASGAMLERLRAKPGGESVTTVLGDFASVPVEGHFDLVYASYNTFFNLPTEAAQRDCVARAAAHLTPGGHLVVEGFVPDPDAPGTAVTCREVDGEVVLLASVVDHGAQTVESRHVTISGTAVCTRPSFLRWATPEQLDAMAAAAGLELVARDEDWAGEPFTEDSPRHVSVYRGTGTGTVRSQ